MATNFIFPKNPTIGDRVEVLSISGDKMPINLVGNSEAGKKLALVFPDQTYSGVADGITPIATINEINIPYSFKCVTAKDLHTWILEDTVLYSKLKLLEERLKTLEDTIESLDEVVE